MDSCILSKFHIKPQHVINLYVSGDVVSYRNSTSNHNSQLIKHYAIELYLIEIPHQTTTRETSVSIANCCILSKFHIKPQLRELL